MLKAAGVENLKTDLWWMPVQRPYNPNAKRMAEMMQADLAKVGVDAKLVSYEWGEYRKRCRRASTRWACSAGPATTATRTTSSPCCWAATPTASRTARTFRSGATADSRKS